jgi:hypothetical protein
MMMSKLRGVQYWRRRWERLMALIQVVEWPCAYCAAPNETSRLLWLSLRTGLYCRVCACAQSYPTHIVQFDPEPPDALRGHVAGVEAPHV